MKFETRWTLMPAGEFAKRYPDTVIIASYKDEGYYVWMSFAGHLWDLGEVRICPVPARFMHEITEVGRCYAFESLWYANQADVGNWDAMKEDIYAKAWASARDETPVTGQK